MKTFHKPLTTKQIVFLKMVQTLGRDKNSTFVLNCPYTVEHTLEDKSYGKDRAHVLNSMADEFRQWKKENPTR